MLCLGHLLAFPLELCSFDDLREVQIEQPSLLTFELRQDITQRLTARVERLGQPFAHLRACQFMSDEGLALAARGRGPARRARPRRVRVHSVPCSGRPGLRAANPCAPDRRNSDSRG